MCTFTPKANGNPVAAVTNCLPGTGKKGVHMLLQQTAIQSPGKGCSCAPIVNCIPVAGKRVCM